MRVVVLGSTGLLGRATCEELFTMGHEVLGVSLDGAVTPEQAGRPLEPRQLDVWAAPATTCDAIVHGSDAIVYALGPDDRVRPPAPASEFFRTKLVEPTVRVARSAVRQGVPRMVVLGSYFTHFDRLHPEWGLSPRHPYIRARRQQEDRTLALTEDSGTALSVLEIPFVFGSYAGVVPLWKDVLLELLRRSPVGFIPVGGSAAVTHRDVGRAVALLATGEVAPGLHPLATDNLTLAHFARVVLDELGHRRRPVLGVRGPAFQAAMYAEYLKLKVTGSESGLDPRALGPDLLFRDLYLDTAVTQATFGLPPRSVDPQIRATVHASYPDRFPARQG